MKRLVQIFQALGRRKGRTRGSDTPEKTQGPEALCVNVETAYN